MKSSLNIYQSTKMYDETYFKRDIIQNGHIAREKNVQQETVD